MLVFFIILVAILIWNHSRKLRAKRKQEVFDREVEAIFKKHGRGEY